MDVFKTRTGLKESILITEENFTEATGKEKPYYRKNKQGKDTFFAVCPKCDNPIQIIGLYKQEAESTIKPYGRHYKGDIFQLAKYDEIEYLACPYSNPNHKSQTKKRPSSNPKTKIFYHMMRKHFDKIIYLLGKKLGINISYGFAEKLLKNWAANEGWRYYESTYENLPYMLLYAEPAYSMYGRLIFRDGEIYQALKKKGKNFAFEPFGERYIKIIQKTGKFLNASFYLCNHKYIENGEHLTEYYRLKIIEDEKVIFQKKIEVEPNYLYHLINDSSWKMTDKDIRLKELAQNILK